METSAWDLEQNAEIFTFRLRKGIFLEIVGVNCIYSQAFALFMEGTGHVEQRSGVQLFGAG
jgi:hypothetical protein